MKIFSREELSKLYNLDCNGVAIDLGCGARKRKGFIGVDRAPLAGVDIVCNIEEGLPFEDNAVDRVYSNFMFEHIKDTIFLFREIYRVCKSGAVIEFTVPYYQSITQYKDPTHHAIITPDMLRYFSDDKWYGSDYGINTNFEIVEVDYFYLRPISYLYGKKYLIPRIVLRALLWPLILFARRYLWNVVHSISIKMKVVK